MVAVRATFPEWAALAARSLATATQLLASEREPSSTSAASQLLASECEPSSTSMVADGGCASYFRRVDGSGRKISCYSNTAAGFRTRAILHLHGGCASYFRRVDSSGRKISCCSVIAAGF
eukprot:TRINITY_DN3115_c0_g1_i9.p1 TRINITY_DN3115_c0_g1~~TRINITY_DN3115_c0_g1_i9.p1  ORF type:complete len:120 (+),score=27.18 TRINITY_DN3115_c0_g1_i9:831-1190(+)